MLVIECHKVFVKSRLVNQYYLAFKEIIKQFNGVEYDIIILILKGFKLIKYKLIIINSYMDESGKDNLIRFAKSSKGFRSNVTKDRSIKFKLEDYEADKYYVLTLTPEESQETTRLLEIAKNKLEELGVLNVTLRLPKIDQVVFTRQIKETDEDSVGGCSSQKKEYLRVDLLGSSKFSDPETHFAFFHEISHIIASTILKSSEDNGFSTSIEGFTREGKGKRGGPLQNLQLGLGLWEEWQADLFAIYCLDQSKIKTPYYHEDAFGVALIKNFALKKDIDERNAFADFFRARVTQDFSFQGELVKMYGTDFVKALNNVETLPVFGISPRGSIRHVAELGGFQSSYNSLLEKIKYDSISLDGLSSSLAASK